MKPLRVESIMLLVLGLLLLTHVQYSGTTDRKTTPDAGATLAYHPDSTKAPVTVTSTLTPEETCEQFTDGTCEQCLAVFDGTKCLWCQSDQKCQPYPHGQVLPSNAMCVLKEARWGGMCWLNVEALIIGVSVTGALFLLTLTSCLCRRCCCHNNQRNNESRPPLKKRKESRRDEEENIDPTPEEGGSVVSTTV